MSYDVPGVGATPDPLVARLVAATLLVTLWLALRPHAAMDVLPVQLVDTAGRLVLLAFLLSVGRVALALGEDHVRAATATPRGRWAWGALSAVTFLALLVAGGHVRSGTLQHIRHTDTYGPLVPWPALELPLTSGWALHVGLGHALVAALVAAVVGATTLIAWRGRSSSCRADAQRAHGVQVSSILMGASCPGCLPLLLVPMAALGLAGPLAQLANPTSPTSVILLVAGPLVALWALRFVTRDTTPSARRLHTGTSWQFPVTLWLGTLPLLSLGFPRSGSPEQDIVRMVYVAALAGALVLTGIVFVALGLYLVRYRATSRRDRSGDRELTAPVRRALITGFLLVPALVIYGIGIYSHTALEELREPPDDALHIDVIAAQFAWEFHYPDGNMTRDELTVPHGPPLYLNVTSQDVIHSLFIPEMGVKIDATPGRVNSVWFQPERTGSFQGYCAEHCGVGHTEMLFILTVLEEGHAPPFEDPR